MEDEEPMSGYGIAGSKYDVAVNTTDEGVIKNAAARAESICNLLSANTDVLRDICDRLFGVEPATKSDEEKEGVFCGDGSVDYLAETLGKFHGCLADLTTQIERLEKL